MVYKKEMLHCHCFSALNVPLGRSRRSGGSDIKWDKQLIHPDDMNLLEKNIGTIKKNTETVIDACKEVGVEVNAEKPKYVLRSF
jgi:hypothetical protein